VKALWQEGHSTRAIAGALGVGHMVARGDIEAVRESGVLDNTPARVVGVDGKSYPARKPRVSEAPPAPVPVGADSHRRLPRRDAQEVVERTFDRIIGLAAALDSLDLTGVTPPDSYHEFDLALRTLNRVRRNLRGDSNGNQ
jgi:hypothetical protein